MGDRRAICLVCRAKQSLQAAARRGALVSSSSSSSSTSTGSWTPARARWHTTTTTGGEAVSRPDTQADTRRVPPHTTPQELRKRRSKRSNDVALAVFQDIVESSRQEEGQKEDLRHRKANVARTAPGTATAPPDNNDWTKLEQITRQQHAHDTEQQTSNGRVLPVSESLYNNLIRLVQMGSQPDASVPRVFAFFEAALYPQLVAIQADDNSLPSIFRQASEKVMHDVTAAKQRDLLSPELPSVARITEIRRQLGLLSTPRTWLALVLELSEKILVAPERTESTDGDNDGNDNNNDNALTAEQRERLVDELIEAWRIFILPDTVIADPTTLAAARPGEFRMPTADAGLLNKYAKEGRPDLAIASLFPRYAPQQLQDALPAVLATYVILADDDAVVASTNAKQKAHEFTASVQRILQVLALDRRAVARIFGEHALLARHMVNRWPLGGSESSNTSALDRLMQPRNKWALSFKAIHQQLGNALSTRNPQVCDAAWEQFWAAISSPDYQGAVRLRLGETLFDYFIMVYTTMRMPERAIAVWNLMATVGVQPTLRTWTSFIEGCKRSSNPQGIHSIWAKLMASGIEVDTAAWTARISGLIQSGEIEAGIQALKEMQATWEAAVAEAGRNGGKPKAVKVTIEPVNAAIAGVLRAGDMQAARQVLAWGGRHGIEPNVTTFNTILRPLVRDGRADEAAGLLEMMRQRGIEPDEATVTILLDGTLGSGAMVGRSAAEQTEMVKQVLAEVEAAGLDANQMTYGKIIYLLLEGGIRTSEHKVAYGRRNPGTHRTSGSGNGNGNGHSDDDNLSANDRADEAVHVVLDRMRTRNIPLSAHIYTILAEHYFALNPPDLAAVKRLIETGQPLRVKTEETGTGTESAGSAGTEPTEQSRSAEPDQPPPPSPPHHTARLDRVFWERVVRGYAQIGDSKSALEYFKHIEDSLSLTNSTLEDLLRALLQNGDWDAAGQLMTKVRAQKMQVVQSGDAARGGRGGGVTDPPRMFRHRFWHLAAQHGLL